MKNISDLLQGPVLAGVAKNTYFALAQYILNLNVNVCVYMCIYLIFM